MADRIQTVIENSTVPCGSDNPNHQVVKYDHHPTKNKCSEPDYTTKNTGNKSLQPPTEINLHK